MKYFVTALLSCCVLVDGAVAAPKLPAENPAIDMDSTYIALYNYGYRNVYELAPQIDPKQQSFPLKQHSTSLKAQPLRLY